MSSGWGRWFVPAALLVLVAGTIAQLIQSERTARQNRQIVEELAAVRRLLDQSSTGAASAAPAPRTGPVTIKLFPTDHVMGSPSAPLTLVEFTDLQCPFCRAFHMGAFEQLRRQRIDTGQVRFISRDLPLTGIHALAQSAARVSRCAGDQNRFWEMRHAILVNGNALAAEMFVTFAQDLGLDVARMITCTNDVTRIDALISADAASADAAGLAGTPVFILGRTEPDALRGEVIEGALPYEAFDGRITALLGTR